MWEERRQAPAVGGLAAARDDRRRHAWWSQWPAANVGVATGATSGVFVLDVDGDQGAETLAGLEHQHGALPETVTALTGGGGQHLLWQHPGWAVSNDVKLRPGLDVRGDGGQIAVAPSLHHSGRCYTWAIGFAPGEVPVVPAPAWLLDLLRGADRERLRRDATPLVLHQGERNRRLFQLACALRRYGLNEDALRACLEAINRAHATPPLPLAEIRRIAKSAADYAWTPPGVAPDGGRAPSSAQRPRISIW